MTRSFLASSRLPRGHASARLLRRGVFFLTGLLFGLLMFGAACQSHGRTSDPKLEKIEEMLDGQLPPGTPLSRVTFFLDARGYQYRMEGKKLVAVIQRVDEDTLTRVTARVEFEFDGNDKLVSYDLHSEPVGP